ncbi:hypothetical protein B0H10DRAFT_2227890 [Mycena sp. CBHHK59/15]|nr:hypothetical protein B0H10DRAFT_2227890 [Mycena sp. CBHHK59/15]
MPPRTYNVAPLTLHPRQALAHSVRAVHHTVCHLQPPVSTTITAVSALCHWEGAAISIMHLAAPAALAAAAACPLAETAVFTVNITKLAPATSQTEASTLDGPALYPHCCCVCTQDVPKMFPDVGEHLLLTSHHIICLMSQISRLTMRVLLELDTPALHSSAILATPHGIQVPQCNPRSPAPCSLRLISSCSSVRHFQLRATAFLLLPALTCG